MHLVGGLVVLTIRLLRAIVRIAPSIHTLAC
jgi:hypothetical protein